MLDSPSAARRRGLCHHRHRLAAERAARQGACPARAPEAAGRFLEEPENRQQLAKALGTGEGGVTPPYFEGLLHVDVVAGSPKADQRRHHPRYSLTC